MQAIPFDFKRVKEYLPFILLIGVGIGTANYFIHHTLNWFQWVILALSTSFLVGFTLVSIAAHRSWIQQTLPSAWKRYLILAIIFCLIGCLASEVEQVIKGLLLGQGPYRPFSGGNIYLFNSIISLVLGFSFFLNQRLFPLEKASEVPLEPSPPIDDTSSLEPVKPISQVPIRKGESIQLIPAQEIAFFEAYDNYSFLYDLKGQKMLCDYSLRFLEKRLAPSFMRVHRKHIVNTLHIKQINPHMNGRYLIQFDNPQLESITSSKSYSSLIRTLIKLK